MRVAVLLLALGASGVACRETRVVSSPLDAGEPVAVARVVRVTEVVGRVTKTSATGEIVVVKAGDALAADEVVMTAPGASARLDVAGVADVDVASATEVSIGELTDTLSNVRLRDGRIATVVHGAKHRRLQVEVPGAHATASAEDGEFSMLSAGSQLSVATRRGQVTLSARGRAVRIDAGQLSLVSGDKGPTTPQALPPSLFLKLATTRALAQREKKTTVRGQTFPGAIVSVHGVRAIADEKGEFAAVVPLAEGANTLVVETQDVLGRTQRANGPRITVDSRAPDAKTRVEW